MAKRKPKGGGLRTKEEYQGLNTKDAQFAEIMTAQSVEELDTMWAAWEERGHDPNGLTRAAVLDRKVELGTELTPKEQKALDLARKRESIGKARRPITGRRG